MSSSRLVSASAVISRVTVSKASRWSSRIERHGSSTASARLRRLGLLDRPIDSAASSAATDRRISVSRSMLEDQLHLLGGTGQPARTSAGQDQLLHLELEQQ